MSMSPVSEPSPDDLSREDRLSALFASLVLQQTNLALMFLGKTPHPESGQPVLDLEAAQMFIENLEMLELKTKGNLNPHEESLLKQSLMNVRLAFVESADQAPKPPAEPKAPMTSASQPTAAAQPSPGQSQSPAAADTGAGLATPEADADAELRKKFVKKY